MWKAVGGPEQLTSECPFLKQTRSLFEEVLDVTWVKAASGKKYGNGIKVCGWHIMSCALRELETAPTAPASTSPSLR